MLIAQGSEAGGHGASRTTIDIVPAIVDLAAGRVPVAAAGGIADGRGLAAMMMLGASGVLLGTRFYASQECDGADEAKKRICAATSGSSVRSIIFDLSRNNVWPAPFNGRCLINDHARRWMGREVELLQNVNAVAAEYAAAKAAGNFDIAAVIAGEAVGLIHDIPPAAEIVDRIVTEADQILLGRRNSSAASSSLIRRTIQSIQRASRTMWPDRRLLDLFKTEFPIVLAPMAGVDGRRARDRGGTGRRAGLVALRDDLGGEGARAGQHHPPARLGAGQPELLLPHAGRCRSAARGRMEGSGWRPITRSSGSIPPRRSTPPTARRSTPRCARWSRS